MSRKKGIEKSGSEGGSLSSSYPQQINAGSTRDESVSSVLNSYSDELNLDAVAASKRYQSKYHGDFNE
ncbi:unnamed protein product [Peronospora effusa]|nr:unnamed protein product [Peronospora effusa]